MSTESEGLRRCSECHENKSADEFNRDNRRGRCGWQRRCKDCARAYVRRWAEENPGKNRRRARRVRESTPRNVAQARTAVRAAIRRGELVRPTVCEGCHGSDHGRIEAHHDDYANPLKVRWLCVGCHTEEHRHEFT